MPTAGSAFEGPLARGEPVPAVSAAGEHDAVPLGIDRVVSEMGDGRGNDGLVCQYVPAAQGCEVTMASEPGFFGKDPFLAVAEDPVTVASVDGRPRRTVRRFVVELPFELVEKVTDAAGLSRKTVDQFVEDVLAREMARWDSGFPLPVPPEDFQRALEAHPDAAAFFATISRRNHHVILARINEAKRPATRARRIEETIAMLLRGQTPHRQ
jgi:hypothetical protein